MIACQKPARLSLITGLASLAAAGGAPRTAVGQDCALAVQATPQVLYSGQRASVNVFAHFPPASAPNAPYAFASAEFDMLASDPAWTFASAGAIVGNDVLGIHVSQPHAPQAGIFADPANPYLVWRGTLSPQGRGPALIEVAADPARVSLFPTRIKTYTCPARAVGNNDWLLANPLSVGSWLAAPGAGTAIEVRDDVIVDGRIITGENYDSACIGLLPGAGLKARETSTRVAFDAEPVTFTATVQAQTAQRSRVTSLTVTFSGLETGGHGYVGGANFGFADGSVRFSAFEGFLGGVRVAAGDFDGDGNNGAPGLIVASLPQTIGARVGTGKPLPGSANTYQGLTTVSEGVILVLQYDHPVAVIIRGADGRPRTVTLDTLEVSERVGDAAQFAGTMDNLKLLSLGCHIFEASGVEQMTVTPKQFE